MEFDFYILNAYERMKFFEKTVNSGQLKNQSNVRWFFYYVFI